MATAGKKPKRKRIKRPDPKQSARFIAGAQELGLDGSGDAFERAMNTLIPKKPKGQSS